jgi:hypothetical protein
MERKRTVLFKSHPLHFFFASYIALIVKRRFEKELTAELQLIQSYRSDISGNHNGNNIRIISKLRKRDYVMSLRLCQVS